MKRIISTLLLLVMVFTVSYYINDILKIAFPKPYHKEVEKRSKEFDVDMLLVYSVMRAESRYNENAISSAGAKGLMQLTDDTFDLASNNIRDNIDDVFDPLENIRAGIWYLGYLKKNLYNKEKYIRAYNCGMNSISKRYPQTEIFADRVFKFYEIYKKIY